MAVWLPKSDWELSFADSQELAAENGAATNVFDGNNLSIWHTQYIPTSAPLPHEIQIDLGQACNIQGFRYLPRQDGSPNGRIGQYEFYVSMDGTNWGSAVATGTFANNASEKQVTFATQAGRYIRLRSLTEVNGNRWTSMAELGVYAELPNSIPRTGWSVKYVDSQELAAENGAATNVFDGNNLSIWHTQYIPTSASLPHEIQIDLGQGCNIQGFRYLPRQDGSPNGGIGQYEFYVSMDGTNWGDAVATGTFANNASEKQVTFAAQAGRYIRLRSLTEVNGNSWTSMAELNVIGSLIAGNLPPNSIINSPADNVTINAADNVTFAGTGSDPDNNLPLSYRWNFGTGSGIADSTLKDPGAVRFNNPGTYTVTFTVTDALGLSDPSPATRVITVRSITAHEIMPNWSAVTQSPFALHDPQEISNPVLTAQNVTDLDAGFVADPFLFRNEGGGWYMFCEVYSPTVGGRIGLATSNDALHWTYDRIVLAESFHLSYPSVLRYDGRYFMTPESYMANSVRIYEASNFPYNWQYSATLVSGRPYVDPSIFHYNNTWWMFVSDTGNSNCYLFYSNDLLSGWVEHPMSPIVQYDASRARPGGRSFVYDGNRVIRTVQNDSSVYGGQVKVFEVDTLTRTNYSEHEIAASPILVASGNGWNSGGMHHFDPWWTGSEWIASVDGWNDGSIWSIGIRVSSAPVLPGVIPRAGWRLQYVDSQELAAENGAATNVFDGNNLSIWHTQYVPANSGLPHEIQIDLGQLRNIHGFRYLPRQDGSPNGRIAQYEFYVSMDGTNWGSAVATGTFANNASEKEVVFSAQNGRYFRFRALSEVNGNPWTSVAEINVLGS